MLGFLGDLLGLNAGNATIDAGNKNAGVVKDYGTSANGIIDTGATQAGGYLDSAKNLYSPLADLATKTSSLYGDALGVNGPAGTANATSAFQTSPGYDFTRDQALQAVDRSSAAHGLTNSGNWINGAETTASGLANSQFGSWLDRLANPGSLISGGVAGESNALGNLANLSTGTATAKTGVAGDVASGLTGSNNQIASGQEANTAGIASLGKTLINGIGKVAGSFLPTPGFGYGG